MMSHVANALAADLPPHHKLILIYMSECGWRDDHVTDARAVNPDRLSYLSGLPRDEVQAIVLDLRDTYAVWRHYETDKWGWSTIYMQTDQLVKRLAWSLYRLEDPHE